MNNENMISTNCFVFMIWCSLPLINDRFQMMRMIVFTFSISSSSEISWWSTVTYFLLMLLNCSSLYYCSSINLFGFQPLYLGFPLSSTYACSTFNSIAFCSHLLILSEKETWDRYEICKEVLSGFDDSVIVGTDETTLFSSFWIRVWRVMALNSGQWEIANVRYEHIESKRNGWLSRVNGIVELHE